MPRTQRRLLTGTQYAPCFLREEALASSPSVGAAERPVHVTGIDRRRDGARTVGAATVNGFDVQHATGRFTTMMPHTLPAVVGRDFAGVVEAVGQGRTDVAVGDEIFGFVPYASPLHDGSFGEVIVSADLIFARKPAGLSFEAAASLGLVVAGATGGVGSIAVQLAVQRGATVVATAKTGGEAAFVRASVRRRRSTIRPAMSPSRSEHGTPRGSMR